MEQNPKKTQGINIVSAIIFSFLGLGQFMVFIRILAGGVGL